MAQSHPTFHPKASTKHSKFLMLNENLNLGWNKNFLFANSHRTIHPTSIIQSKIQNGWQNLFGRTSGFSWWKSLATRQWWNESGYFNDIIKELKINSHLGFRAMFHMDVIDFDVVLSTRFHLISHWEINVVYRSILGNERLSLTLWYTATGASFQSLSYQLKISLNAVSQYTGMLKSNDWTACAIIC